MPLKKANKPARLLERKICLFQIRASGGESSSVQFRCSVMSDSLQPHEVQHTRPPCPSPTPGVCSNSSIELVMPSKHLILCRPLLLLPSIFPSIRVSSNESALRIRWPKYWSFSFKWVPSSPPFYLAHSFLISVRYHCNSLFSGFYWDDLAF